MHYLRLIPDSKNSSSKTLFRFQKGLLCSAVLVSLASTSAFAQGPLPPIGAPIGLPPVVGAPFGPITPGGPGLDQIPTTTTQSGLFSDPVISNFANPFLNDPIQTAGQFASNPLQATQQYVSGLPSSLDSIGSEVQGLQQELQQSVDSLRGSSTGQDPNLPDFTNPPALPALSNSISQPGPGVNLNANNPNTMASVLDNASSESASVLSNSMPNTNLNSAPVFPNGPLTTFPANIALPGVSSSQPTRPTTPSMQAQAPSMQMQGPSMQGPSAVQGQAPAMQGPTMMGQAPSLLSQAPSMTGPAPSAPVNSLPSQNQQSPYSLSVLVGVWKGNGQLTKDSATTAFSEVLDIRNMQSNVIYATSQIAVPTVQKLVYTRTLTLADQSQVVQNGYFQWDATSQQLVQWYSSQDGYNVVAAGTPNYSDLSVHLATVVGGLTSLDLYGLRGLTIPTSYSLDITFQSLNSFEYNQTIQFSSPSNARSEAQYVNTLQRQ